MPRNECILLIPLSETKCCFCQTQTGRDDDNMTGYHRSAPTQPNRDPSTAETLDNKHVGGRLDILKWHELGCFAQLVSVLIRQYNSTCRNFNQLNGMVITNLQQTGGPGPAARQPSHNLEAKIFSNFGCIFPTGASLILEGIEPSKLLLLSAALQNQYLI